jgi:hypothetical protein
MRWPELEPGTPRWKPGDQPRELRHGLYWGDELHCMYVHRYRKAYIRWVPAEAIGGAAFTQASLAAFSSHANSSRLRPTYRLLCRRNIYISTGHLDYVIDFKLEHLYTNFQKLYIVGIWVPVLKKMVSVVKH